MECRKVPWRRPVSVVPSRLHPRHTQSACCRAHAGEHKGGIDAPPAPHLQIESKGGWVAGDARGGSALDSADAAASRPYWPKRQPLIGQVAAPACKHKRARAQPWGGGQGQERPSRGAPASRPRRPRDAPPVASGPRRRVRVTLLFRANCAVGRPQRARSVELRPSGRRRARFPAVPPD